MHTTLIATLLLLLAGLALTAAIIAANGYFVAQEFAYMSVDRVKLRARAEAGDASAKRALAVTKRTSFMLSGAQLGITVTGLMVGYVAEPFIGEALGALLGGVGVPAAIGITIGTVGALVLATVVQMLFGELYPEEPGDREPRPALTRSRALHPHLPDGVRMAHPILRRILERACCGSCASSRCTTSTPARPPRTSRTSSRTLVRAATCRKSWRCCSIASSIFPTETSNTR